MNNNKNRVRLMVLCWYVKLFLKQERVFVIINIKRKIGIIAEGEVDAR